MTTWVPACDEFSTPPPANTVGADADAGRDVTQDAASTLGCAAIDATKCFDFDGVPLVSTNWAAVDTRTSGPDTPTLDRDTFFSPGASARFQVARPDAGAPYAVLIEGTPALSSTETMVAFHIRVEGSAKASAHALYTVLNPTEALRNSIYVRYDCEDASLCSLFVDMYTSPPNVGDAGKGGDAGDAGDAKAPTPVLSRLRCGTFPRNAWTSVSTSFSVRGGSVHARCQVDANEEEELDAPNVRTVAPILWSVGLFALGTTTDQTVNLDDVWFRY